MLHLPTVTLCAIDTNPELAVRAIKKSSEYIKFGRTILVTSEGVNPQDYGIDYPVICVHPETAEWPNWYAEFLLRDLHKFIETDHVLKIEWDGYAVNPRLWMDDFLKYDYIGAPWAWKKGCQIGNGGFSLRSRRLLKILGSLVYQEPVNLDDEFISIKIRDYLTRYHGIQFPSSEYASYFSHERSYDHAAFGFHGLFNFWRYHSDGEMIALAKRFPEYVVRKPEYRELAEHYRNAQNNDVYHALINRLAPAN